MSDLDLRLTGSLHPHLLVSARPPAEDCTLHLELSIPDALFPDPDELVDQWGLSGSSDTVAEGASRTPGVAPKPHAWSVDPRMIDIERPVLASAPPVHLSLAVNVPTPTEIDIPLHARYLPPTPAGGHNVTVFGNGGGEVKRAWVCGEGGSASTPETIPTQVTIQLPAAKPEYQVRVEIVTAAVVWLGWAWMAYKIVQVVRASQGTGKVKPKTE